MSAHTTLRNPAAASPPPAGDAAPHLHVVVAADHRFAMPLGVTLNSAVRALAPQAALTVYVLDGGLTARDRTRIEQAVGRTGRAVEWRWVDVDRAPFDGLMTPEAINHVTYFRLSIPDIVPLGVGRVLYLDSDLAVRHDLARLWAEPLHGATVGAVRDFWTHNVSSPCGLQNVYHELGLEADTAYFNAGVLLIDLDAWRRQKVSARALAFLRDYHDHVLWADQDGLNAALAGAWQELSPGWNYMVSAPVSRGGGGPAFFRASVARLNADPGIVHFATSRKPWHPWYPYAEAQGYFDDALWASGWFHPTHRLLWTASRRARTVAEMARFHGGGVLRRLGLRRR